MTIVDDELSGAVADLHAELDRLDPPPFRPSRSRVPVAFVLLVVLLGIGIAGLAMRAGPDDESGGVTVATQPDEPAGPQIESGVLPAPGTEDGPASGTFLPDADDGLGPDGQPAGEATPLGRSYSVTDSKPGEFIMPLPMGSAWNEDQRRLVVYRTGNVDPGHQVIDTLDDNADPIELPFTPADIEQIYWNPLNGEELLYAISADLMSFDLTTREARVVHRFDGCDRVDSGVLPVPPADDGTMSLLCHVGAARTQMAYDLGTGEEQRAPTQSDSAAFPTPRGNRFVRVNSDGSASVLDRTLTETGVELDLAHNVPAFVTLASGEEWAVATLFDGAAIGSLVLLPLDGADAVVVIGPERGDAYPPSGTLLSASGDKVVLSIQGADDGVLAGRITLVDLASSLADPARWSIAHRSEAKHDYWSVPFISVTRMGVIAYSTDNGGDTVNTFVATFNQNESAD